MPRYFKQSDRERHNKIRSKFIEPIRESANARAVEVTDYQRGIPSTINTAIYFGETLFGLADVRWRDRWYDTMDVSQRNCYMPLSIYGDLEDIPLFIIWAVGDGLEVRAWQFDSDVDIPPKKGGRTDRNDPRDKEEMVPIPTEWLETPEGIWKRSGLIVRK